MIDPDIPVPLLLEALKDSPAWLLMRERLERILDNRVGELASLDADTSGQQVQRKLGFIEGLRWVLKEPDRLDAEWKRAHKATTTTTRATR